MQATAARTKVDRVTAAMVREAYKRTGRHPVRNCYRDGEGGACPLYAVALTIDEDGPNDECDEDVFIQRTLQLTPGYFTGFLRGFDEPEFDGKLEDSHTTAYVRGFEDGLAVATKLLGRTHAKCDPPSAACCGVAVP